MSISKSSLSLFLQHSRKGLTRTQDLDLQIDAFGLNTTVDERAGAVIVPARKRKALVLDATNQSDIVDAFITQRSPIWANYHYV